MLSGLGGTAGGRETVRDKVGGRAGGGRGLVVRGGSGRPLVEDGVPPVKRGGLDGRVTAAMGLSDSQASISAPRNSTRWSGRCEAEAAAAEADRPDASCMALLPVWAFLYQENLVVILDPLSLSAWKKKHKTFYCKKNCKKARKSHSLYP